MHDSNARPSVATNAAESHIRGSGINMAMTTRRPGAARKSKASGAKTASTKARSAKAGPVPANPAAHILPAAKGPRTVSHRKIKQAVDNVFRERSPARA